MKLISQKKNRKKIREIDFTEKKYKKNSWNWFDRKNFFCENRFYRKKNIAKLISQKKKKFVKLISRKITNKNKITLSHFCMCSNSRKKNRFTKWEIPRDGTNYWWQTLCGWCSLHYARWHHQRSQGNSWTLVEETYPRIIW